MVYSFAKSKPWRSQIYTRKRAVKLAYILGVLVFTIVKTIFMIFYAGKSNGLENSLSKNIPAGRHLLNTLDTNYFNCSPRAIANFPRDIFSDDLRQHGWVIIHALVALYMFFGLAIVCDEYFVPCLECISESLNLSPDVAGATFMAAGSSAPELATTIIGVFIAKDDIGLGAVVGSADYNVMFVISACALFAKSVIYLNWWPLVRDCVVYMICICLLAIIIHDGRVYWYEGLILLVCYGFYILLMYYNRSLDNYFTSRITCCPTPPNNYDDDVTLHWQAGGESVEHLLPTRREEFLYTSVSKTDSTLANGFHATTEEESNDVKLTAVSKHSSVVGLVDNSGSRASLASSADSVGELRLPQEAAIELDWPPSESDDNSRCYGCFNILNWPQNSSLIFRVLHVIGFPLKALVCVSIPDCRLPRFHSWFWASFIMSCVWITLFSYTMIWMITIVGYTARVPDTVMGLTFIAAGSSVPDVIASVIVVREGKGDMAVSNAVGSNIFDILVCMGLPWLIKAIIIQKEIPIYSKGLEWATLTLLSTVVILLSATHINRWRLTKPYGVFLMIIYLAFLVLCTLYELNVFGYLHPKECDFINS